MRYTCLLVLYLLSICTITTSFTARYLASSYWLADLTISFLPQFLFILLIALFGFVLLHDLPGIFISGIAIIFLFSGSPNKVVSPLKRQENVSESIRLLQYNLFSRNDQVDAFIDYVLENQPAEMILLQEVAPHFSKKVLMLKSLYPYHTSHDDMKKSGLAVFSQLPIGSHQILRTHKAGHYYIRVSSKTRKNKKNFVVYNVHLFSPKSQSRWEHRNQALISLGKKITMEAAKYRIIIGDFNTSSASPWIYKLQNTSGGHLASSPEAFFYSWSMLPSKSWWNGVLIDHMLLSGDLECLERKSPGDFGSDHLPIVNTVVFN